MTNQTVILSFLDFNRTTGIAVVSGKVNEFIQGAISEGQMNFCIHKVVITPETSGGRPTDRLLFTVQVDYYAPELV